MKQVQILLKNLGFKLELLFNEKLLLILIFLKTSPLYSSINIVYLDVQYIVDNSNLGKIYKNELKKTQQKNNQDIKK